MHYFSLYRETTILTHVTKAIQFTLETYNAIALQPLTGLAFTHLKSQTVEQQVCFNIHKDVKKLLYFNQKILSNGVNNTAIDVLNTITLNLQNCINCTKAKLRQMRKCTFLTMLKDLICMASVYTLAKIQMVGIFSLELPVQDWLSFKTRYPFKFLLCISFEGQRF